MKYVITGVTGHTGSVAAKALLDAGEKVRVVVRDAAKGKPWADRGAEVAVADLADTAALSRALEGVDGAYFLVPPSMTAPDFRAYQKAIGDSIVAAVKRSKLPHAVLLSSVGAQHEDKTGPIKGLHAVEKALAAVSGTVSTFVRSAYFMENFGGSLGMLEQGVLPAFQPTNLAFDMVASRDIGAVIATALREGAKTTSVIELSAARRYSWDDAAAILSKITGRTVQAQQFPIDAMVPTLTGFGFPKDLAELYREMTEGVVSGQVAFEGGHRRVHGPTDLETVLEGLTPGPSPQTERGVAAP